MLLLGHERSSNNTWSVFAWAIFAFRSAMRWRHGRKVCHQGRFGRSCADATWGTSLEHAGGADPRQHPANGDGASRWHFRGTLSGINVNGRQNMENWRGGLNTIAQHTCGLMAMNLMSDGVDLKFYAPSLPETFSAVYEFCPKTRRIDWWPCVTLVVCSRAINEQKKLWFDHIDMAHEVEFFIVRLFNWRMSTPCISTTYPFSLFRAAFALWRSGAFRQWEWMGMDFRIWCMAFKTWEVQQM